MRWALLVALVASGCARVLGFEEPVLETKDAEPPEIVREPCTTTGEIETKTCEGDASSTRICNADGWSSWSACAKAGFRPIPPAPIKGRMRHTAVWTGDELIVWGGRAPGEALADGAAYDPVKNTWRVLAQAPLNARSDHVAVWTGKKMIVWGGRLDGAPSTTYFADGAAYDPRTNRWEKLPGSPMSSRALSGAVWSTTTLEVLVWGGIYEFDFTSNEGGALDPRDLKWTYLPLTTAAPRAARSSFWDGERMIVVGGDCKGFDAKPCNDVWALNPSTALWERLAALPVSYAPNEGYAFAARPGGKKAFLFGGEKGTARFGMGAIFDVPSKSWRLVPAPSSELGPKPERTYATAFFVRDDPYVYGGFLASSLGFDDRMAFYATSTSTWTEVKHDLGRRMAATATQSHDDTFIWGGRRDGEPPEYFVHLADGAVLRAVP